MQLVEDVEVTICVKRQSENETHVILAAKNKKAVGLVTIALSRRFAANSEFQLHKTPSQRNHK